MLAATLLLLTAYGMFPVGRNYRVCVLDYGRSGIRLVNDVVPPRFGYVFSSELPRVFCELIIVLRGARWDGIRMVHTILVRDDNCGFPSRDDVCYAVSASIISCCASVPHVVHRTSAGLYYFSAKLAPKRWAPLASWITGWANVTGQVTLVCSIDFTWCVLPHV